MTNTRVWRKSDWKKRFNSVEISPVEADDEIRRIYNEFGSLVQIYADVMDTSIILEERNSRYPLNYLKQVKHIVQNIVH